MAVDFFTKQQVLAANNGKIVIKKPKIWLYPRNAERSYERELVKLNKKFYKIISNNVNAALPELIILSKQNRPDSSSARIDAGWTETLGELTSKVTYDLNSLIASEVPATTSAQATAISIANKAQFIKVIHSALSINPIIQESYLETQLASFQQANTALITNLAEDQAAKMHEVLSRNLSQGNSASAIRKELKKNFNIGERRARLIARDQTNKFNGQLTQLRQQDFGIKKYTWLSSQDERVRTTHRVNNREIFSWKRPPATGHPGSAIQCRCTAQTIINEDLFI